MTEGRFHNRRAVQIENDRLRVTVTVEGGHIAEVLDKASGVNPLWIPPWPSIEPSSYSLERHPEYGNDAESRLLAGIMGHNLCLDLFGPPSAEEAAAGMAVHGEANLVPYEFTPADSGLTARCTLAIAQLAFEREIRLRGPRILIRETVENLAPLDRPIAWTQHVTLGPPFLERGATQFRVPATRSRKLDDDAEFEWPMLPGADPRGADLRVYTNAEPSGGYTAHLLDPKHERSWFFAWSPASHVVFGYVWRRADFPWLGIWEENRSRTQAPWNGRTMTRGTEFGVSPIPESRRQMIGRHTLFGTPCYRWLPARSKATVEYYAGIGRGTAVPESLDQFESLTK